MKKHLISDKVLFYIPFLGILTIMLINFNNNFSINGGEYEFRFYELIILFAFFRVIQFLFYLLSSK